MVLVDTNVVANMLLKGEQAAAARALYARDADWHTEPLLFTELTNVLATAMRVAGLQLADTGNALQTAHRILDEGMHAMPDADVLTVAAKHGVSGYDARFLCAAIELGTPLVTEDAALRRKAPTLTCSIAEALAA